MIRLKYLARFQKGRIPPELFKESAPHRAPYLSMEYLRSQTEFPEFAETEGAIVAQDGDIILLWDGSNAGEFIKAKYGVVSSTAALVRVVDVMPGYFFYLCKTLEKSIRAETVGMGIPHVNGDFVGDIQVTVPSIKMQSDIAASLDRRTGELDRLIAGKLQLVDLLIEKRRALIANAVSRGLNLDVSMRDSGIDWVGQIPSHWSVLPLRRVITSLDQGWSPVASNLPAVEGEYGVLKLSAVKAGYFFPQENKALLPASDIPSGLDIKSGDVFLTRANTPSLVGDAAMADEDFPSLVFSDLIYRLRINPVLIDPRWLVYVLISDTGRRQVEAEAKGSSGSMVKLAQDQVLGLVIPVPPLAEQIEIVREVSNSIYKLKQLADATRLTVDRLIERRTALIVKAIAGEGGYS